MDNMNLKWAYKISEILYSQGIRHICICPGARNTALTIAFTSDSKFNTTSHIDERSAGYFALGLSKANRVPTVILTTSGTAVANVFPSIIEANYSKTPIIVLTADRPNNKIGIGDNQAINQRMIYGDHVRSFYDIGLPSNDYRTLTESLISAYNFSIGSSDAPPGPVHINTPFDVPIASRIIENNIIDATLSRNNYNPEFKITCDNINFNKSIIICGEIHPNESLDSIIEFSEYINAPILSDPTSNLRYYKKHPNIVSNYNYILNKINCLPSSIIRFGRKPTSKVLNNLINKHKSVLFVDRYPTFNDSSTQHITSDYVNFLSYVKVNFSKNTNNSLFDIITKYQKHIKELIENASLQNLNCEGLFINELLNKIKSNSSIFIGNSMAIREADDLTQNFNKKHKVYCNRGASGIDGLVSTSLGISYAQKNTTNLNISIIGDLSFYHDMNGLHFSINNKINTKFIIINNNGGGIFSTLPINDLNYSKFNKYWTTPLNIDLQNVAKLYNIDYMKVINADQTLDAIYRTNDIIIIDYNIDLKETEKVKEELISQINKKF